ncbi:hypothetical protein RJT34_32970 [Clitoria ternatea]|uniref:Uncharacterized protein n=1 Tax=Clitoria ternatea TaxID=43366 RepID=A0AAN9EZA1_CLITE
MGLEIFDEFRAIMPIRTARTFSQRGELETTSKEQEECHTPTSQQQTHQTLLCPPPPKKPRLPRTTNLPSPSQIFFQVPHDLASVFLLHSKSSKEPLC